MTIIRPLTTTLVLLASTAAVAITIAACTSDRGADLPPPSTRAVDGLPYTLYDTPGRYLPAPSDAGRQRPFTLLDIDGDGSMEMAINLDQGGQIHGHDGTGNYVIEQFRLPTGYVADVPFVDLAPLDVDGDGSDELVVAAPHDTGDHWRVWLRDVRAGAFVGDVMLPTPDGRRRDGRWDGKFTPIGALPIAGRPRPALLLVGEAGYDVTGRGLVAIDPIAGEICWHRRTDARLRPQCTSIADIDGDGRFEVVCGTAAVDNLEGARLHDVGDDSSRVFVFDDQGEVVWQRALAGPGASCRVALGDADADGQREIITVASGPEPPRGRLTIWSVTGERTHEHIWQHQPVKTPAISEVPGSDRPLVAWVETGRRLVVATWRDGVFETLAERRYPQGNVVGFMEAIEAEPGRELIVSRPGRIDVLSADLRLLAAFGSADGATHNHVVAWEPSPGQRVIQVADGESQPLTIAPAPRSYATTAITGGAVALGIAGLAWRAHRRRRERRRRDLETDPAILRELRLQLLARLAKGDHEKIGALKTLRRLAFRLESEAVKEAEHPGAAPSAAGHERIAAAVRSFDTETRPRLDEVLTLARRVGAPDHLIVSGEELLDELAGVLARLTAADTAVRYGGLDARVGDLAGEIDGVLQRLRRSVEQHVTSDVAAAVARVLEAQRDELAAHRVSVTVEGDGWPVAPPTTGGESRAGPRVHIDAEDLDFVLDNLVGNAVRAMSDSRERTLTVRWLVDRRTVYLLVTDTGCGIAPDDHEAIFEEGWSDRPGGGYGLARSRREVALFGGTLTVARSEPGRGTTFELGLPVVAEGDRARE
ncbi:hypothetical protein GF314_13890 [bacterium]|nr:hypothetical protein [bacterium]